MAWAGSLAWRVRASPALSLDQNALNQVLIAWPCSSYPSGPQCFATAAGAKEQVAAEDDRSPSASAGQPDNQLIVVPEKEESSYVPAWLRDMIPGTLAAMAPLEGGPQVRGAKNFMSSKPSKKPGDSEAPSSKEEAATKKEVAKEEEQMMQELEEAKNMDMDGYVGYCRKVRIQTTSPPRPRLPPVPRWHHDYTMFVDLRRASYLRICQHEKIGSAMTEEEKDQIFEQLADSAEDKKLLDTIAKRTGIYMDLEVKDCIKSFIETRESSLRQFRWVKELGRPAPKSQDARKEMNDYMDNLEKEEKRSLKLIRQDTVDCPMRPILNWVGPMAVCSKTGLKYYECCGNKALPVHVESRNKAEARMGERGRLAPRNEAKVRKQRKTQDKPNFQK
eukprot:gene19997-26710_t